MFLGMSSSMRPRRAFPFCPMQERFVKMSQESVKCDKQCRQSGSISDARPPSSLHQAPNAHTNTTQHYP